MKAHLDTSKIRELASPAGVTALATAVYAHRYQQILTRFIRMRKAVEEDSPALASSASLVSNFEILRQSSPHTQRRVLGHPAASMWVNVAEDLIRRRSHVLFPEMHMESHLNLLGRLAAAALFLDGGSGRVVTRVDGLSRLHLPGTSGYFSFDQIAPFGKIELQICSGRLEGCAAEQCRVVQFTNGIELDWTDISLRGRDDSTLAFDELSTSDVVRWRSVYDEAWTWIRESMPRLADEIAAFSRVVLPLRSSSPDVHASATFREAPGQMALSWTPDASVLVEAIVHEYHHDKLNAILSVDPLITGPTAQPIFYSPWRKDSRPLLGILHGAYVFQAILTFWTSFFEAGIECVGSNRIRQRLYLIQAQTSDALSSLRSNAELTPLGRSLLEQMQDNVRGFPEHLMTSDPAVRVQIDTVRKRHLMEWQNSHPAVSSEPAEPSINSNGTGTPFDLDSLRDKALSLRLDANLPVPDPLFDWLSNAGSIDMHQACVEISTWPDSSVSGLQLLKAHAQYILKNFCEAADLYARVLGKVPDAMSVWYSLAFALRHMHQWVESETLLKASMSSEFFEHLKKVTPPATLSECIAMASALQLVPTSQSA